jgi:hypothetical protein
MSSERKSTSSSLTLRPATVSVDAVSLEAVSRDAVPVG